MAPITWRNITAPDTGDITQQIGEARTALTEGLGTGLDSIQEGAKNRAEQEYQTNLTNLTNKAYQVGQQAAEETGDVLSGKQAIANFLSPKGATQDQINTAVEGFDKTGILQAGFDKTKQETTDAFYNEWTGKATSNQDIEDIISVGVGQFGNKLDTATLRNQLSSNLAGMEADRKSTAQRLTESKERASTTAKGMITSALASGASLNEVVQQVSDANLNLTSDEIINLVREGEVDSSKLTSSETQNINSYSTEAQAFANRHIAEQQLVAQNFTKQAEALNPISAGTKFRMEEGAKKGVNPAQEIFTSFTEGLDSFRALFSGFDEKSLGGTAEDIWNKAKEEIPEKYANKADSMLVEAFYRSGGDKGGIGDFTFKTALEQIIKEQVTQDELNSLIDEFKLGVSLDKSKLTEATVRNINRFRENRSKPGFGGEVALNIEDLMRTVEGTQAKADRLKIEIDDRIKKRTPVVKVDNAVTTTSGAPIQSTFDKLISGNFTIPTATEISQNNPELINELKGMITPTPQAANLFKDLGSGKYTDLPTILRR